MLLQLVYITASYTQITQTVGPLLSAVYLHAIFDGLFPTQSASHSSIAARISIGGGAVISPRYRTRK